ncbi:MAG: PAS domain-containing protein, partial [Melioribacteraceae bacterium]|nr:PAS domain-containing protein [Melioribacteraceae bacterium]
MSTKTEVDKLRKANLILKQELQKLKAENNNFKKIIKKTRQLEDTINVLVESAGLGTWDHNLKTDKVVRNSAWAEQLGYTLDELNPDFFQFKNLVHPKDFKKIKKAEIKHLSGKQPFFKVEHRMKTKEGEWKWILNWGKIVKKDRNGEPVRAVGTHIDISEFKNFEQKLKISEKQYKALFDYAPIGLWEQDVTELVKYLQQIKQSGVKDFNSFFNSHPNQIEDCIKKIKPLKMNKAALKIHEAESIKDIQNNIEIIFTDKSKSVFKEQIIAHANGESSFESETETKTLTGKIKKLRISMSFSYLPYKDKKVILFSIADITIQKAA